MTETAAYGTWKSPISAADVATGAVRVSYPGFAGGEVWWQERRPSEGGRTAIVASTGGEPRDLLPAPWNARTRVHEYGGKSYLAVPSLSSPGGATPRTPRPAGGFDLVFANFADQRLYAAGTGVTGTGVTGTGVAGTGVAAGTDPVPLTPAAAG